MPESLTDFLRGGTMVAFFSIGLFLLRFWKESNDRLFIFFSAAFLLMAVSQLLLLLFLSQSADNAPAIYWIRLLAFLLIIIGIVEKNLPEYSGTKD